MIDVNHQKNALLRNSLHYKNGSKAWNNDVLTSLPWIYHPNAIRPACKTQKWFLSKYNDWKDGFYKGDIKIISYAPPAAGRVKLFFYGHSKSKERWVTFWHNP
jgi:hypothetical protein